MTMIADTHVHCWDLTRAEYAWLKGDTSVLNRSWSLDQVNEARAAAGVTTGVLVQAAGNWEDTSLMLETAERHTWIQGIVAWLPLEDPARAADWLQNRYAHQPLIKGIRHQIHDEKDPRWLLQPSVIESLQLVAEAGLPFDVVAVKPEHMETALEVAGIVPGLKMVIDHLAQPPIASEERFGKWGGLMQAAATNPSFYAKISGLGTASGNFEGRRNENILPYVEFALKHFGMDRCFCGSDWPVSVLTNDYAGTWEMYKDILGKLVSPVEQEKILYHNAVSFYRLKEKTVTAWRS